jgi:hypothetical protein
MGSISSTMRRWTKVGARRYLKELRSLLTKHFRPFGTTVCVYAKDYIRHVYECRYGTCDECLAGAYLNGHYPSHKWAGMLV